MKSMVETRVCAGCGAVLRSDALEGLCARCLFGALMTPAPKPAEASPTEVFGDYELRGVIARGGSGVVHRARHIGLDRVVALKILAHEAGGGSEFLERLRTEAAAAAGLEHAHIVPVYDVGSHQGRHYLAMKLVDGETAVGRMEPRVAARRLITVARAVLHAHQRGVLHRDLKPANILLDHSGEPHLTDFGLAKLMASDATITRTRAVLGTPAYMAPEQATGQAREITTAADIYGLGAVLYHWLTGGPPFAGGTTVETIRLVVDAEPEPPSRRAPGIDRDLDTICLKCLRKEPTRRYATADALAVDLERWLRGEPVQARPVHAGERLAKWMRRNRALSLVLGGSLSALVAAAGALAWKNHQLRVARGETAELAQRQRDDLVRLHVATGNHNAEEGDGYAALSSFAKAAELDAGDAARLEKHRFRFAATLALLPKRERVWWHDGAVHAAALNADGTRAVTASADRTARVWDSASGQPVSPSLPHADEVWWCGFAAGDSRVLTRTKSGGVQLWDAATGAPCGGPFAGRGDMPLPHDGLAKAVPVSPDGTAFVVLRPEGVEVRSTANGALMRDPLPCPPQPGSAAFSPDGTQLVVACETGGVEVYDLATGRRVGALPNGAASGTSQPPVGWRSVTWSPDGRRLALTDRVFSARLMPRDASSFSAPLGHQFMVLGSDWSSGSDRLVTWSFDNTARWWDVEAGRLALPPMRHRGPVLDASLNPNGRWLASACRDGTVRLWDITDGQRPGSVLRHRGEVLDVAWSRDGALLLTTSADHTTQLWRWDGGGVPRTTCRHRGAVEGIDLSPDGQHVATLALEPDHHVPVWRFPGGECVARLPHPRPVASTAWIDATRIVTVTGDGTVRLWDALTARVLQTVVVEAEIVGHLKFFDFSPDGRELLAAFDDRDSILVEASTGRTRTTLPGGPQDHRCWSSCGRFLLTMRWEDGAGRFWLHDMTDGTTAALPSMPEGVVAVGPGADRLALVDGNDRVWVLDRRSGRRSAAMPHDAAVQAAGFAAAGAILVTGTRDGILRFWDAATGEPLSPPMRHASWIMAVAVDADGHRVFTGVNGGVLSEWVVPACDLSPSAMAIVADGPDSTRGRSTPDAQ